MRTKVPLAPRVLPRARREDQRDKGGGQPQGYYLLGHGGREPHAGRGGQGAAARRQLTNFGQSKRFPKLCCRALCRAGARGAEGRLASRDAVPGGAGWHRKGRHHGGVRREGPAAARLLWQRRLRGQHAVRAVLLCARPAVMCVLKPCTRPQRWLPGVRTWRGSLDLHAGGTCFAPGASFFRRRRVGSTLVGALWSRRHPRRQGRLCGAVCALGGCWHGTALDSAACEGTFGWAPIPVANCAAHPLTRLSLCASEGRGGRGGWQDKARLNPELFQAQGARRHGG